MKRQRFYCIIPVIIVTMIACNPGSKNEIAESKTATTDFDMQKAKSFIDSINAKFTEQVKKGDSVALASHYSPDAELLLSNSDAIKGKDILSAWGSMIRMGVTDFRFNTTDITGNSEFLIETGTYEMSGKDNTPIDKGKYVVVWKQVDGQWKLYRDIGNTSLPAAPAK